MGQANISKAKYLQPSRRKKSTNQRCVVCGKMIGKNRCRDVIYELCHKHYMLIINTSHESRLNLKQVVILMKQIREECSQSHGKEKSQ